MRAVTPSGTLWTLFRNGETARATMVDIEGVGLELRYTRNGKPFVRRNLHGRSRPAPGGDYRAV